MKMIVDDVCAVGPADSVRRVDDAEQLVSVRRAMTGSVPEASSSPAAPHVPLVLLARGRVRSTSSGTADPKEAVGNRSFLAFAPATVGMFTLENRS